MLSRVKVLLVGKCNNCICNPSRTSAVTYTVQYKSTCTLTLVLSIVILTKRYREFISFINVFQSRGRILHAITTRSVRAKTQTRVCAANGKRTRSGYTNKKKKKKKREWVKIVASLGLATTQ